jgi:hypothetical protein
VCWNRNKTPTPPEATLCETGNNFVIQSPPSPRPSPPAEGEPFAAFRFFRPVPLSRRSAQLPASTGTRRFIHESLARPVAATERNPDEHRWTRISSATIRVNPCSSVVNNLRTLRKSSRMAVRSHPPPSVCPGVRASQPLIAPARRPAPHQSAPVPGRSHVRTVNRPGNFQYHSASQPFCVRGRAHSAMIPPTAPNDVWILVFGAWSL